MSSSAPPPPVAKGKYPSNVTGNSRITGALGAAIFVLLFAEGLTIPVARRFISVHVFVGMLLVAFVVAKIASTSYRIVRYYSGRTEYVEKGPPPIILRVLGPVVTVTTVAVLATGIGLVLDTGGAPGLLLAHKVSFVVWFCAMTVHVLGHALETPALASADWRRSGRADVRGKWARFVLIGAVTLGALALAIASRSWAHHWHQLHVH